MGQYLTAPVPSKEMPKGIPYIVGNEAAERFSFYGMKAILFVFMTQYLVKASGESDVFTATQAREYMGWFVASAYFFPLMGALIADAFWGKYKTILFLSLFYCLGHGTLALMDMPESALQATMDPKVYLFIGLGLIALGSGGIKPCVSAHVGDQFGKTNKHLLSKVFEWFYFSINVGSFASTLLTPWLLEHHGPAWAFGVPGVLMGIATFAFWMGRKVFVHIPPAGPTGVAQSIQGEGGRAVLKLLPIYVFVAIFWSLYDQSAAAWVDQATRMDRKFVGFELLESQVQAINPLLILTMIPLFSFLLYPLLDKLFGLTPLRKIGLGFFLTAASFALIAVIEQRTIDAEADFNADIAPKIAAGEADLEGSLAYLESEGRPAAAKKLVEDLFDSKAVDLVLAATDLDKEPASAWPLATIATVGRVLGDFNASLDAEIESRIGAAPKKLAELKAYKRENKAALKTWDLEASARRRTLTTELETRLASLPANADATALEGLRLGASSEFPASTEALDPGATTDAWLSAGGVVLGDGAGTPIERPNIIWQLLAYVLLTAGEVMVSITALEFAYTQAPPKMKSLIMTMYLLSVSAGNVFTALVNRLTQDEYGDSSLVGADYYWFFTKVMLGAAVVYIVVAYLYQPKEYLQEEASTDELAAAGTGAAN